MEYAVETPVSRRKRRHARNFIVDFLNDKHGPGGQKKSEETKNMLFNWHGWPVGLILPEGGLVKESFTSNKLKGCWVPQMTFIVEVRPDLLIDLFFKVSLSLSLWTCVSVSVMWRCTINLQYGNTYLYNLLEALCPFFVANYTSKIPTTPVPLVAATLLDKPVVVSTMVPNIAPSLIYDGFTSGMHGGTKCLGKKKNYLYTFCCASTLRQPHDSHHHYAMSKSLRQWFAINMFHWHPQKCLHPKSFKLLSVFADIKPEVSSSTFTLIPRCVVQSWKSGQVFLGLQESRKQRATSKKYTMIPILQEVTNFSSVQR